MRWMTLALLLPILVGASLPALAYHGVDMPLELSGSARTTALGGAFLAVADDEWAPLYNPAGLARLQRWGIATSHADQFGVASVTTVAAAGPWLGTAVTLVHSGLIEPDLAYVSLGGVAGVGIPLFWGFSVGARGRAVRMLAPGDNTGWAADLALLWRGPFSLGFVVEGLWSQDVIGRGGHHEPWPQRLAIGAAVPLNWPGPAHGHAALTLEGLGDRPLALRAGVETWIHGFGFQAGVAPSRVSLGISVRWNTLQLDGVTVFHDALGTAFRGTLTVRFQR